MSQICVVASISGHVQGVGFRFHTAHEGTRLSLTGYAKNLSNGKVEVLACGEEASVMRLLRWLEIGPSSARVDSVINEGVDWRAIDGFSIL
ncbi:acylphosphatase [Veronia nyctiphanis]|uniref:Acylphosphatase n=1 Tax=Veronia nyctiphanis TaxID=1278244 RepID=A0A4Q0YRI6_9GAMM|nr:acylphosphatase [Veronia nyctiphanis]RXJ73732.1 acylphosphatase [Veronia nyctiphanis]